MTASTVFEEVVTVDRIFKICRKYGVKEEEILDFLELLIPELKVLDA